jgi:hypothetical protein
LYLLWVSLLPYRCSLTHRNQSSASAANNKQRTIEAAIPISKMTSPAPSRQGRIRSQSTPSTPTIGSNPMQDIPLGTPPPAPVPTFPPPPRDMALLPGETRKSRGAFDSWHWSLQLPFYCILMIGLHVTITSLSHPLRMWPFPLFLWGSGLSLPLHLCPSSLSPTAFFAAVAYSASVVVITPLAIIALVPLLEPGLDNHTIIPLLTLFFLGGYVTPFILAGFFPEFNKSTKHKDEVKTAASKSLKAAQEHKCDPCTIASLGATTDLQVMALRNAVGNIDRRAETTGWWKWIGGKLFYLVLIVLIAFAASALFAR